MLLMMDMMMLTVMVCMRRVDVGGRLFVCLIMSLFVFPSSLSSLTCVLVDLPVIMLVIGVVYDVGVVIIVAITCCC